MFVLTRPEEFITVMASSSQDVHMNVMVSFEEQRYESIVRGDNIHLHIHDNAEHVILPGPLARGTTRTLVGCIVHNHGLAQISLVMQLHNTIIPLELMTVKVPIDTSLIYGAGGWEFLPPIAGTLPGVPLFFGAENIANNADTRFLAPGYMGTTADTVPLGVIMPREGLLASLYVKHHAGAGNGNPVIYRTRVNGAFTGQEVTVPTGVIGVGIDTVHSYPVNEGDTLEVVAIKPSNIGTGAVKAVASMRLRLAP